MPRRIAEPAAPAAPPSASDKPGAVAFSADGRTFHYEAPIGGGIQVGGWVAIFAADGAQYLGLVSTHEITRRDGSPSADGDARWNAGMRALQGAASAPQSRERHVEGTGVLLARHRDGAIAAPDSADSFDSATVVPASAEAVARYLDAMSGHNARLDIGAVQRCEGAPAAFLRADGFDRHTFLCGQSGSGKTYMLGLILEQLVLNTDLNITIIDPNSDFVRLDAVRPGTGAPAATSYARRARNVQVIRPAAMAATRSNVLSAWFSDLAEAEQAAALRLDPLHDRDEYAMLSAIGEQFDGRRYSLADVLASAHASELPAAHHLAMRIQNLHVAEWSVWAKGKDPSTAERIKPTTRAVVLDIGSIPTVSERAAVAAVVLGNLWRNRGQRQPRLIVIDEAHNVCPAEPANALQQNATEYCINIAAEGRKFGFYLLISTQRPQKVHRNVLSQCDNLVLMRMNSRVDLHELADSFSFVSPSLLEESMRFRQGDALVAGKVVPTPFVARVGGRISEEAGADVPATWAARLAPKSGARKLKR